MSKMTREEKLLALKNASDKVASEWKTLTPDRFIEMISEIFPHIDQEDVKEIVMTTAYWANRHF